MVREVSDFIRKRLIEIGGYALEIDGVKIPNLRFIWAEDTTQLINGKTVMRYPTSRRRRIVSYNTMTFYGTAQRNEALISNSIKTISVDEAEELNEYGYKKYPILIPNYDVTFEGEKMWILEGWLPIAKFKKAWYAARYRYDPITNELVDILGDPPEAGGYDFIKRMNGEYGAPDCTDGVLHDGVINYVQMLWNRASHDDLFSKFDWKAGDCPADVIQERAVIDEVLQKEYDDNEANRLHQEIQNVFEPAIGWITGKATTVGSGKVFTGEKND